MFAMGLTISGAILFLAMTEFHEIARKLNLKFNYGLIITGAAILLCVFFLASPVYGQDSTETEVETTMVQSSTHTYKMNLGPVGVMTVSVDSLNPQSMKIITMGNTVSVDIDTSIMPFDTIAAIIDSASSSSNLTFSMAHAFGDDSEDDNGAGGVIDSVFGSMEAIIIVAIVFISLLLMGLGIPILLFILLLTRWRWIHRERMKAIETGIVIPPGGNGKDPSVFQRKGLILFFIGIGFMAASAYIGGFPIVVGIIIFMWGLGNLAWFYTTGRKNKKEANE